MALLWGATPAHPGWVETSLNNDVAVLPSAKRGLHWANWLGIALFALAVLVLLFNAYGYRWELYVRTVLMPGVQAVFCAVLFRWWLRKVRRWYPDVGQTRQRIFVTFAGYVGGILVLEFLVVYPVLRGNLLGAAATPLSFGLHLATSVFIVLLVGMVYENTYYLDRYRAAITETETARNEVARRQLEAIKQQINPHFLFNSLNILDALIDEEPAQAHAFLDELASVYRYLLRANEQPLTPLSAELDFIRSYFHLLKTRHGRGLHLNLRVAERHLDAQLPPLTLQLLVENAVKHNVVLPEQPLTIGILTDEAGQLVVENNLQRRPQRVRSNGVGLTNILAQYQMLGQPAPTVHDADGRFVVKLPLVSAPDPVA